MDAERNKKLFISSRTRIVSAFMYSFYLPSVSYIVSNWHDGNRQRNSMKELEELIFCILTESYINVGVVL